MNSKVDFEAKAAGLLTVLLERLQVQSIFFARHDAFADLILLSVQRESAVFPIQGDAIPAKESICRIALQLMKPVEVECLMNDPRTQELAMARRLGDGSFFAVPVRRPNGDSFGTLCTYDSVPRSLSGDDKRLLEAVADSLSLIADWATVHHYDPLSGLFSRNYLKHQLPYLFEGGQAALLYVDLDHFKVINHRFGYDTGDASLKAFGALLQGMVKDRGLTVRLGGDKFLVLLIGAGEEEAVCAAGELLAMMEAPLRVGSCTIHAGCSIGISLAPADGQHLETLLLKAENMMMHVKGLGGGSFAMSNPLLHDRNAKLVRIENLILHAVDRGEMAVVYQPVICMETGEWRGLEALLRWYNPELGQVSPTEFIPVAEASTLILSLGEWVIRQVCMQVKEWQAAGFRSIPVSVNVSARQFEQQLVRTVQECLSEYQLDPSELRVEITESMLMQNEVFAASAIKEMKLLGINCMLDDFGTGYSSLAYLRRFPFDYLKIDRSFISDITHRLESLQIVKAIIAMAEAMNMRVVAEGVETQEQYELLKSLGVHCAQGYWMYRPMRPDEMQPHMPRRAM